MRTSAKKLCVMAIVAVFLLQPLALAVGTTAQKATSAPAFTRTLKLGSKGADVQALQKRLKDLGYFKDTVTTNFGSVTLGSVKAFQKAKHLTVDGIVGRVTYNALYAKAGASAPATAKPTATPKATPTATPPQNTNVPAFTGTLRLGSKGADVQALQRRLKALGYFKATVTTNFGSVTLSAVKAFQKAKGLTADGIVGRVTYNALYAGAEPTAQPTVSAKPTASAKSTASAIAAPSTGAYSYGRLQNQTALRKGDSGADVRDLQTALKQKGFFQADISGNYETLTQDAVMKFQRSVGLDTDGIAGNYTLSALYSLLNPPDLSKILPWPDLAQAAQWADLTVEKLNWTDADTKVLPKGTNAVVVDVLTGYTFHIRRTGGTLHADVETLSALDTATFYKTAGNFTWNRRAIWLIVNGRRLAASMNVMPHGYESIAGNDMIGQFCIHFVNSRTHGSNIVDPAHQKAIEVAFTTEMTVPAPPATPTPKPTATPAATATPTAANEPTDLPAAIS